MVVLYKEITISKEGVESYQPILDQLVALSKAWEIEKIAPAYDANTLEYYLDKPLFIATVEDTVVAYALGEIKKLEEATSYNKVGETSFELDEIYVQSNYRSQGVGKKLYDFLENALKGRVDVIGVIATSYKHEQLLHFYVDTLGMDFKYALVVKRL